MQLGGKAKSLLLRWISSKVSKRCCVWNTKCFLFWFGNYVL